MDKKEPDMELHVRNLALYGRETKLSRKTKQRRKVKEETILYRIQNSFGKCGRKIKDAEAVYLGGNEYRELYEEARSVTFLPDGTEEVYGLKLFRVNAINHFRVV